MPVSGLPALERRLEALLLELEKLYQARPSLPDALARAGAGQRIDELLDEIRDPEREITLSPAMTLQDAAVKLRRLSVYLPRAQVSGTRARAHGSPSHGRAARASRDCRRSSWRRRRSSTASFV